LSDFSFHFLKIQDLRQGEVFPQMAGIATSFFAMESPMNDRFNLGAILGKLDAGFPSKILTKQKMRARQQFKNRDLCSRMLIAFVMVMMWVTGTSSIAQAQSSANAPPRIKFSNITYHLAWRSDPQPGYSKLEYLPKGQKPSSYRNMLLLERLSNGMTVKDVVGRQVAFLRERKKTDPVVNYDLIQNERTGEYLLDFVMGGVDEKGGSIVEWNAYRYMPYKGADGKSGVQLYGYSARGYGDEGGRKFLTKLRKNRSATIQALVSARLP